MRRPKQQRTRGNRESMSGQFASPKRFGPSAKIFQTDGIDINTNLGEGFGHYRVEGELDVLPYVTSANIACGAHAGDPVLMEAALEEVRYYGLSLGAHIGYPDLQGFGRREIHLSPTELRASILFQLGALNGLAKTLGFEITQVRPHGFLYRQIAHDSRIAAIVAKAIAEFDRWLVLIGPAGPNLLSAGDRAGIRVAGEAWVDRTYDSNGNLLPHSHSKAVIRSTCEILDQATHLINDSEVIAVDGTRVKIDFQTIHLHPQMIQAKQVAEEIRFMLPRASSLTAEPYSLNQETQQLLAYAEN